RRIRSARQSLYFETAPIRQRVPFRFFHQRYHIFVWIGTRRILRRNRHAIENSEVVQPSLRVHHFALPQRRIRLHLDLPPNDPLFCVHVPAHKHVPHARLGAFFDVIGHLHFFKFRRNLLLLVLSLVRLGRAGFVFASVHVLHDRSQRRFRISLVVVERQNLPSVARNAPFRIGLPRQPTHYAFQFLVGKGLVPLHRKCRHARLNSFVHLKPDKHVSTLTSHIVLDICVDLRI